MKKTLCTLLVVTPCFLLAQKYFSRSVMIDFYSHTSIEDIKAKTEEANGILNEETGEFVFRVLMNSFVFPKAAMQQHFNEKYVESDQFPHAIFKGKIDNFKSQFMHSSDEKTLPIKGIMEIHGVKKEIQVNALLKKDNNQYTITSTFHIAIKDFHISTPAHLISNIAKNIQIQVKGTLQPLN